MTNQVWFAHTQSEDLPVACRRLLAAALGGPARVEHLPGGQPWLPEYPQVQVSLAHTRGGVAVALSEAPVGLDLERLGRPVRPGLADRYFTPTERAYARDPQRVLEVWTRKEALLKREGIGLRMRLGRVETLERPDLVSWRREGFQFSFCGTPAVFCWHCIPLDGEQPR